MGRLPFSSPLNGWLKSLASNAPWAGSVRRPLQASTPPIWGSPVPATQKALARAGLSIDEIDVVEINEAFGSRAVACLDDRIARERVNIDGAIAPASISLGATGADRRGKRCRC